MKKILLLGSTGFIGHNMLDNLHEQYNITSPTHKELDVLDEVAVAEFIKSEYYDVVLNCLDLHEMNGMYFENKLRMFNNLARCNDYYGKMIYFGTGAEYARDLPVESIEEKEFDRKIPLDTYGSCMHQIAKLAMISKNIYNLRLFGIFGKYEIWQHRFISNAICKAMYGYPITIRQNLYFDYLYVDDLCDIVRWFIENTPKYHDYNAVSGKRYSLKELAELVVLESQKELPIFIAKDGIGREYSASNKRLCDEMIDFKPMEIQESIHQLMYWYMKHQEMIDRFSLLYQ